MISEFPIVNVRDLYSGKFNKSFEGFFLKCVSFKHFNQLCEHSHMEF